MGEESEDPKNKLTLERTDNMFDFFGKDAELVKFEAPGSTNSTKTTDGSWKPAFHAALAACTEAAPMKMWFRGLNKDFAETTSRRRLFALSERFRRVREFQASTEMS